jgi:hypothetical protein
MQDAIEVKHLDCHVSELAGVVMFLSCLGTASRYVGSNILFGTTRLEQNDVTFTLKIMTCLYKDCRRSESVRKITKD